ncbi:MAG: 30S ribosomal protein S17 [Myxococcales bacterium]|nr:30S ribosomal protein S17 [Myxococcales bacterium]
MADTIAQEGTQDAAAPQGHKRKLVGLVKSNKMDKTVVVEVTRRFVHKKYKKYVRTRLRYKAHDENNQYNRGDRVEITESRPLSKDKRWVVTRLVAAKK